MLKFVLISYCFLPLLFIYFLLQYLLKFTISKKNSIDEYYYIGLVLAIKKNKNRFVSSHPNIIDEENFVTPQLFFWACSFFPEKIIRTKARYLSYVIHIILFFVVIILFTSIYSFYIQDNNVLIDSIFVSVILYIFTPYNYASWVVRNIAFSARGFGILLGILQIYLVILAQIHALNIYIFLALTFLNFSIIIGSLFTIQFSFFFLLFISFFFHNYFYFLTFPTGFLVCYILLPSITKSYLRGQYWHKLIFKKYLSNDFLLQARLSIWRDLVYDIWVKIFKKKGTGLYYIITNPLIFVIYGIPSFIYCIVNFLSIKISSPYYTQIGYNLFSVILSCFFCFIITSFRNTRFLGEPERYMEFAIPFCIMLLIIQTMDKDIVLINSSDLWLLTFISVIITSLFLIYNKIRDRKINLIGINQMIEVKNFILEQRTEKKILLSNSWNMNRMFFDTDISVPQPEFTSLNLGPFKILEIFKKSWVYISEDVLDKMIEYYKPDIFIFKRMTNDFEPSSLKKYIFIMKIHEFEIFGLNNKIEI
jgi:hypothetical protein